MEDGYDAVNLARARDMAMGRRLDPLPPEAFRTRSPRDRGAPPGVAPGPGAGVP